MDATIAKQINKRHIKSKKKPPIGKAAVKKKFSKSSKENDTEKARRIRNPKAFAVNSAHKAEVAFRRLADMHAKRHHLPSSTDRSNLAGETDPPYVVAIVGPPKVGKTTLLKSLIKNFTRQPVSQLRGPVTLVIAKKRRITLLECANDINCMIDVAKVADLVLLLVDAKFGYEMETFEFLNICQVHGFPQVMGVLTHLDQFSDGKQLKKTKKKLKRRFWTDVYPGAKLFYLSGVMHDEYKKRDVQNLGRFIAVQKYPHHLQWRTQHPYVLVDRLEDATDAEKVKLHGGDAGSCDRTVYFYGYMRGGVPMRAQNAAIHIPGVGDYANIVIEDLPDPCPLPDKQKIMRRALNERERQVYAPFSGIGGVLYDKDALYINLGGSHYLKDAPVTTADGVPAVSASNVLINRMLAIDRSNDDTDMEKPPQRLSSKDKPIDVQLQSMHMQLITNGAEAEPSTVLNDDDDDESDVDDADDAEEDDDADNESDAESDDEDDDGDEGDENVADVLGRRRVRFKDQINDDGKDFQNDDENDEGDDDDADDTIDLSTLRSTNDAGKCASTLTSATTLVGGQKRTLFDDDDDDADAEKSFIAGDNVSNIKWKTNLAERAAEKMTAFSAGSGARIDAATLQRIIYGQSSSTKITDNSNNTKLTKQIVDSNFFGLSMDQKKEDIIGDELEEELAGGILKRVVLDDNTEYNKFRRNANVKLWPADGEDCSKYDVKNSLLAAAGNGNTNSMPLLSTAAFTPAVIEHWKLLLNGCFVKNSTANKRKRARTMLNRNDEGSTIDDVFRRELAFSDDDIDEDDDAEDDADDDKDADDGNDDFEDLETGQVFKAAKKTPAGTKNDAADSAAEKTESKPVDGKLAVPPKKKLHGAARHLSSELMKAAAEAPFLDELRRKAQEQTDINKQALDSLTAKTRQRIALEGYRAGTYVRVCVQAVPHELLTNFDPTMPIILGSLRANEHTTGL